MPLVLLLAWLFLPVYISAGVSTEKINRYTMKNKITFAQNEFKLYIKMYEIFHRFIHCRNSWKRGLEDGEFGYTSAF